MEAEWAACMDRWFWQELLPFYAICALSLVVLVFLCVVLIRRLTRGSRRRALGLCPRCAYNLTGNSSGRCPECGRALDDQ